MKLRKECENLNHDFQHLKRYGRADHRCPKCGKNVMMLLALASLAGIDLTKKMSDASKLSKKKENPRHRTR